MRGLGTTKEQIPRAGGIYPAKLAEEYDGIGQYVLVALSSTSTGAAFKARVASGDFGGSRTFPKGTPVAVHSYNGLMEVLSLGNKPRLLCDPFSRIIVPTSGDWADGPIGRWRGPDVDERPAGVYVDGDLAVIKVRYPDLYFDYLNDPSQGIQLNDSIWSAGSGSPFAADTYTGLSFPIMIEFRMGWTSYPDRFFNLNYYTSLNIYLSALWGINSVGFDDWIAYTIYNLGVGGPINGSSPFSDKRLFSYIDIDRFRNSWATTDEKGNHDGIYDAPIGNLRDTFFHVRIRATTERAEMTVWADDGDDPGVDNPSYWVSWSGGGPKGLRFFVIETLAEGLIQMDKICINGTDLVLPVAVDTIDAGLEPT